MELWGPPQHNTVRECGYGPLETEKSRFGTISGPLDKKFFFFPRLWEWVCTQFQKSADMVVSKRIHALRDSGNRSSVGAGVKGLV